MLEFGYNELVLLAVAFALADIAFGTVYKLFFWLLFRYVLCEFKYNDVIRSVLTFLARSLALFLLVFYVSIDLMPALYIGVATGAIKLRF